MLKLKQWCKRGRNLYVVRFPVTFVFVRNYLIDLIKLTSVNLYFQSYSYVCFCIFSFVVFGFSSEEVFGILGVTGLVLKWFQGNKVAYYIICESKTFGPCKATELDWK